MALPSFAARGLPFFLFLLSFLCGAVFRIQKFWGILPHFVFPHFPLLSGGTLLSYLLKKPQFAIFFPRPFIYALPTLFF
jgi:hypothetical protein